MATRLSQSPTRNQIIGRRGLLRKAPVWHYPARIERSYIERSSSLIDKWRASALPRIRTAIESAISEARASGIRTDAWSDSIESVLQRMIVLSTDFEISISPIRFLTRSSLPSFTIACRPLMLMTDCTKSRIISDV